jgi:hypothetical protein
LRSARACLVHEARLTDLCFAQQDDGTFSLDLAQGWRSIPKRPQRECRRIFGFEACVGQGQSPSIGANIRQGRPDYAYLKDVFRQLRAQLDIVVSPRWLPHVPCEEMVVAMYETV